MQMRVEREEHTGKKRQKKRSEARRPLDVSDSLMWYIGRLALLKVKREEHLGEMREASTRDLNEIYLNGRMDSEEMLRN